MLQEENSYVQLHVSMFIVTQIIARNIYLTQPIRISFNKSE